MTKIETMIQGRARQWLDDLPDRAKSNLVRLTADFTDNHVSWQVVVLGQADDDEIEEYACIFTEVLADFSTATGYERVIKVKSAAEAIFSAPLPIEIYSRGDQECLT